MHNPGMKIEIPKLLDAMMEKEGLTQAQLANRLSEKGKNGIKVKQPYISKWRNGQSPEGQYYGRIIEVATEFGILADMRSEDVAAGGGEPRKRTVRIKGYVGAGDQAHYYAVSDEDFAEVEAPALSSDQTVAVEIRGKSFGPLLDSWLVFYDDVRSPVTSDLFNEVCVVGLDDDRILIKQIKPNKNGTFTLLSNGNEPPIENVQIEWAAKVIGMRAR